MNFLFVTCNLTYFSTKFKKTCFLKQRGQSQYQISMQSFKISFFLENKCFDRKEDSMTKCYCIKSKLTVFWKFLTFSFKIIL